MKRKILLINAPSSRKEFISVLPPLGVLSLAAFLKRAGIKAAVADFNADRRWRENLHTIMRRERPDVVGISSNFSNLRETLEIAGSVKSFSSAVSVVAGGPHPSIAPEEYSSDFIDYIIPYEAELPLLDFFSSSDSSEVAQAISARRTDLHTAVANVKRNPVEDLDSLPFPAYDMVDLKRYVGSIYKSRPLASIVTSRGCPYKCIFCSQAVFERRWRAFSADYVVEQMRWMTADLGIKEILIEDDNFTYDTGRVFKICELILAKGIKIRWQLSNGVRADKLNKDLLRLMKRAGCWKISIAPEVGDEESLKALCKGMDMEHFIRAAEWCKELKIEFFCFFLMGFPFQTEKNMENTIRFALRLDPLMIDLNKIVPFPGTAYFSKFPDRKIYRGSRSYLYKGRDRLVDSMCTKAYLRFYARPVKLLRIFLAMGPAQFINFIKYAIRVL
ncbi:MAG: radical SAM protein [Candidatus Omnitrophota bacterium]|jgi:radical SAM superfamily enzyme YgiQ (UPF0313 family)